VIDPRDEDGVLDDDEIDYSLVFADLDGRGFGPSGDITNIDQAIENLRRICREIGVIKMGPSCPHCGNSVEWTVGEVWEDVYSDKTYTCSTCYSIFVIDLDVMLQYQEGARKALGGEGSNPDSYDTKPEDVDWEPPAENEGNNDDE